LPRYLGAYEYEVQQLVKKSVGRGKVNVYVRIDRESAPKGQLKVDPDAAQAYMQTLEELRQTAGITEEVKLEHLLSFSDVFAQPDDEDDVSLGWSVAAEALDIALKDFRSMRLREGEALADDLRQRLKLMSEAVEQIEERAPERVEEAIVRVKSRIASLVEDEAIDETRLATEVAMLADRFDITEECVRLKLHITVFDEALSGPESPGRKLNFLTQEMHREVNTIGSKANDFSISNQSVQLKEELEKIREQVQNIQ
jgi:uncharacterized protein (TIGR00255 family)